MMIFIMTAVRAPLAYLGVYGLLQAEHVIILLWVHIIIRKEHVEAIQIKAHHGYCWLVYPVALMMTLMMSNNRVSVVRHA